MEGRFSVLFEIVGASKNGLFSTDKSTELLDFFLLTAAQRNHRNAILKKFPAKIAFLIPEKKNVTPYFVSNNFLLESALDINHTEAVIFPQAIDLERELSFKLLA